MDRPGNGDGGALAETDSDLTDTAEGAADPSEDRGAALEDGPAAPERPEADAEAEAEAEATKAPQRADEADAVAATAAPAEPEPASAESAEPRAPERAEPAAPESVEPVAPQHPAPAEDETQVLPVADRPAAETPPAEAHPETEATPAPAAEETAAMPPAPAADQTAAMPPAPAVDETAAMPPAAADETTAMPPAAADETTAMPPAPAADQTEVSPPAEPPAPAAAAPTERLNPVKDEPMAPASPLAQFPAQADAPRKSHKRGLVVAAIVVAVAAVAYGIGAWFVGDKVPNGTVVAGVSIGGLPADEARQRLESGLADVQGEVVPVSIGGENVSSIDPAAVGLALDADATLDRLVGFSLDPRVLWGHIFGRGEAQAVSTVDEGALHKALETAASELDVAPVEGAIAFTGATPEPTEPVAGRSVDVEAAQQLVLSEWLSAERPIELPTKEVQPAVNAAAVEKAMTELAHPLVSGPVAVSVEDKLAQLSPETLAAHASFVDHDGALELEMDGDGLAEAVQEANPEIGVAGEDAKIILNASAQPEIVPSTSGRGLDPKELAQAVATAGTSSDRTATVQLVDAEPEFSTEDAQALGIKEIIADFSTPMPYDPVRTKNLEVGTAKVTGVIVKPGEEFSLLKALGPITAANGYVSSGVVEDGFSTTALGGGLSQLSTNMYNVGLISGMDDVTHQPHSRWFDRYPAGREATLWEGQIDMVWRNNTDYGILVHAWVGNGRVHTRLWSTKVWDVNVTTSDHYNITKPTTVYNPAEKCIAESGGQYGFTVTVTRERSRAGQAPESQKWSWTYQPWNKIVCGEKPSPKPEPSHSPSPSPASSEG
ncbi:VanW family protein [Georgenia thermotolerans]|uniref:Vanomycin resistance protein VanB n=1 Tax=Georgenia thermotolerans TaxID=527326 RepID=A0A7J5UQS5_9MICO|nr:VanW family protein [Georgenia thermotolerans]KAE8764263.1 vanomycin resistance protein VanB [Georgenia thermotolerans]